MLIMGNAIFDLFLLFVVLPAVLYLAVMALMCVVAVVLSPIALPMIWLEKRKQRRHAAELAKDPYAHGPGW